MITGRLPHDTLAQVVKHSPFPRPAELNGTVVPALDAVVMRALDAEPERRWTSVEAMRAAFVPGLGEQLATRRERPARPAPARHTDWSSQVVELMDRQEWRDAEVAARSSSSVLAIRTHSF